MKTDRKQFSLGFYFVFIFTSILLDQISKLLIERPFRNYNFAFSLVVPKPLMYGLYFIVITFVVTYILKNKHLLNYTQQIAWSLILGGAISNIGERLVLGYVRDYIYLFNGILNIADFFILSGIILLLYSEFWPANEKSKI